MKTTYTNEQLQEAVDRAFRESSGDDGFWLGIARAFLDNLPELSVQRQLEVAMNRIGVEHTEMKVQEARAEKAEAELAKLREACARMSEQEVLSLSQLRPLSEAGDVPEGCIRVRGWEDTDRWYYGWAEWEGDTHFADIRLPEASLSPATEAAEPADPYAELKAAHAAGKIIEQIGHGSSDWFGCGSSISWSRPPECYRTQPEPETFEAHGKTWTRHTPGDPMPCDGEVKIYCIGNMKGVTHEAYPANWWNWSEQSCVIGWRYADEPKQNLVPDQTKDVWTPQVGEVVRLKSGGPLMTVMQEIGYKFLCAYDSLGEVKTVCISPDCLKLSTKEDAR